MGNVGNYTVNNRGCDPMPPETTTAIGNLVEQVRVRNAVDVRLDTPTIRSLIALSPRARVQRIVTILRERYGLTDYATIQAVNRITEDAMAEEEPHD